MKALILLLLPILSMGQISETYFRKNILNRINQTTFQPDLINGMEQGEIQLDTSKKTLTIIPDGKKQITYSIMYLQMEQYPYKAYSIKKINDQEFVFKIEILPSLITITSPFKRTLYYLQKQG